MNEQVTAMYEEYNRYIYHLCLKLTRNTAEAEDLMQEVWVKVVRYEENLKNVEHQKAWLTTICMNTFRDRYRKKMRRSKHITIQQDTEDFSLLDLVPSGEELIEEKVEKDMVRTLIQTKMKQLDAIYEKTLWYFYIEQYSLIEISNVMKVSIGTVKSRLFRAKARLKEMLMADKVAAEVVMPV